MEYEFPTCPNCHCNDELWYDQDDKSYVICRRCGWRGEEKLTEQK